MAANGAAKDLCPTTREVLLSEGIGAHSAVMTEIKGGISHALAMLRAMANKKFDEIGGIEARAVDRVLGTLPQG